MVCQYLEDLLELYLLGITSPEESSTIADHLSTGCANCLGQLRDAALTVYLVSQPKKPRKLDPKWRTSLLRRLRKA